MNVKKRIKKIIVWGCGFLSVEAVLYGVAAAVLPRAFLMTVGIIGLCLNVATGMLAPNPISIVRLVENICVAFGPGIVSAVILICLGVAGAVVNFLLSKKKCDRAVVKG